MCERFRKCLEWCKVYKIERKKKRQCYQAKCRTCGKVTSVNHDCCIQPITEEKEQAAAGVRLVEAGEDPEDSEAEETSRPPLELCFANMACTVNENQEFVVHKVGWSYADEDTFYEVDTVKELIKDLDEKTVVDGQERQVFCYFHNFKGFDGVFIQDELFQQGHEIEKILNQGAKMMSFESGILVFRDSLNFFNMPLEKLPATFNLRELHKGYFPYTWIKPDYYSYRGGYPPVESYEPDLMSEKKRKAFLTWHAEKVNSGAMFDFHKELSA